MEDNNQLNYSWLGGLSNANHDGTTQQIDDTAASFETENLKYHQMATAVHQARVRPLRPRRLDGLLARRHHRHCPRASLRAGRGGVSVFTNDNEQ